MVANSVKIVESWKLNDGNEIMADIQHSLSGLKPGTLLTSKKTNYSWKVAVRVIFIQLQNQRRFVEEAERLLHIKFESSEMNFTKFQDEIASKENEGIYHYSLTPIGHREKPDPEEDLEISDQNNYS